MNGMFSISLNKNLESVLKFTSQHSDVLAKTCNYGVLGDSFIRDRIVIGIQDRAVRKCLLHETELFMAKTNHQLKTLKHEEVDAVKTTSLTSQFRPV